MNNEIAALIERLQAVSCTEAQREELSRQLDHASTLATLQPDALSGALAQVEQRLQALERAQR
jgi:hypothetical protein